MASKKKAKKGSAEQLEQRLESAQKRLTKLAEKQEAGPDLRLARKRVKRAQRAMARAKQAAERAESSKKKKAE